MEEQEIIEEKETTKETMLLPDIPSKTLWKPSYALNKPWKIWELTILILKKSECLQSNGIKKIPSAC